MKIKTFNRTWTTNPSKCQHEWRLFGTRLEEEVWTPVHTKPLEKLAGWVICDKCGWNPFVYSYREIGKRDYYPFGKNEDSILLHDVLVEVLEWGTETQPTEPVVMEFAYAEWGWWDKLKRWCWWDKLKRWCWW